MDSEIRVFCPECNTVFYANPVPVVSAVVINEKREILLVLRDREPHAGKWCLPSGFVELNESIENGALRELAEETGLDGTIIRLLDTLSFKDDFYGDLIWITFEIKWTAGKVIAGDDARAARFFPLNDLPELAFKPNSLAVNRFLECYSDLWKMQDSFQYIDGKQTSGPELPSDVLFKIISRDAHIITNNWMTDVRQNPTTKSYSTFHRDELYQRAHNVVAQFGEWMVRNDDQMDDVWSYYRKVGSKRCQEGFRLAEVLSAVSLTRKHIFAHVFSKDDIWSKPLEMYIAMEFMSRVNLFFDKANYHIARGYELVAV